MKIKADGETDAATIKYPMQVFMLYTSFHEQHSPHLTSPYKHTHMRGVRCAHQQTKLTKNAS